MTQVVSGIRCVKLQKASFEWGMGWWGVPIYWEFSSHFWRTLLVAAFVPLKLLWF